VEEGSDIATWGKQATGGGGGGGLGGGVGEQGECRPPSVREDEESEELSGNDERLRCLSGFF
jgi:hypothetical protein